MERTSTKTCSSATSKTKVDQNPETIGDEDPWVEDLEGNFVRQSELTAGARIKHHQNQNNKQLQLRRTNNMTESLRPLRENVIVTNLEKGERLSANGIIIPDDDGKDTGIRARWAQVYAVGPEQKDVEVGTVDINTTRKMDTWC